MINKLIAERILPFWYRLCTISKLKNKALFIEIKNQKLSDNYTGIISCIKSKVRKGEINVIVDTHYLMVGVCGKLRYFLNCVKLMPKLATSKYVFVNDCSRVIAHLKLRKDTTLIQTWHGCGALKKFGYSTGVESKYYGNEDIVTVSSDEEVVVKAFAEAMGLDRRCIYPIGVPRTDMFFRKSYFEKCKQLREEILAGRNKKIILFAPTYRGTVSNAQRPSGLNLDLMYKHLGQEYILITKTHSALKKDRPLCRHKGFFYDVSDEWSIAYAMGVCDVLITDYSSLIFEYSLLLKPAIFYGSDLEQYERERGFYIDYKKEMPGVICRSTMEIISEIKNGALDVTKMKEFQHKYMRSCDGHSAKRLVETIFGEGSE
ncbi:MAG: CDP-glycerol glycerophosphotransferase family protein [Lachnospiraceae bacterium]|nr:CDP-glycerol glycerophosphotransferase family protein [Lachnospiraceae bacterium]